MRFFLFCGQLNGEDGFSDRVPGDVFLLIKQFSLIISIDDSRRVSVVGFTYTFFPQVNLSFPIGIKLIVSFLK